MANYISIPILDELVHFAEQDFKYEDAVKAVSSSILVHYFPPLKGFSVVSEQNRNNHYADYIVLRIQRRFPGDRGIVDHTVVEAEKQADLLYPRLVLLNCLYFFSLRSSVHTTTGCGKQGFPSAQPYLSHTPAG